MNDYAACCFFKILTCNVLADINSTALEIDEILVPEDQI